MQKIKTHFRKRLESHILCYLSFLAQSFFDLKKAVASSDLISMLLLIEAAKVSIFKLVRKE